MQANSVQFDDAEARSAPRTNLFLSAMIRFDGGLSPVRMRDLSACGAKVEGSLLPPLGAAVRITRGALVADGIIAWREDRSCGVRFDLPINPDAWVPGSFGRAPALEQQLDPSPSKPPIVAYGAPRTRTGFADALPGRLAEELHYVCRMLEGLGDELAGDHLVIGRHSAKLQDIDISAQILGHVARLLVSDRPEQAVERIGMESLRKRLQRTAL